jgi:hypothetical protein
MVNFTMHEDPGNEKTYKANRDLPRHITKGIRMGAYISGKQLVANLRSDMREKKHGKVYKVSIGRGGRALKKSRLHTASSAAETPAMITGDFSKSIDFKVKGNRTLEFGSGSNGYAEDYAKYLETIRKPLGRTVRKLQNNVKTNIKKEINKQIKQLGFDLKGR